MNDNFAAAMCRATLSIRASQLGEATRLIQDALAGGSMPAGHGPSAVEITPPPSAPHAAPFIPDPDAMVVEPQAASSPDAGVLAPRAGAAAMERLRKPLGEVVRTLREGRVPAGGLGPLPGIGLPGTRGRVTPPAIPDGAQFVTRSFTCAAGMRSYRLYIPASAPERPLGLVVMLHGCKQDPDDFATGTGMNAVAEAHGLIVAYPGQTGTNNAASCWNWFRPSDQMRDAGEPSIIAGITREIMTQFGLDRDAVFVAGLSAGGAMAAVMSEAYPDLYAAVGVHSGLACGSANDVMSAFAVMRGEPGVPARARPGLSPQPRTIVFQGSADSTVHPSNASRIVAAAAPTDAGCVTRKESGRSVGGRGYSRTVVADREEIPVLEYWLVDGAGHAWSGGQAGGSFTDPSGPDASCEMVRFFLSRRH